MTGRLVIHVPVKARQEYVAVRGLRVIPWLWRMGTPIEKGSVDSNLFLVARGRCLWSQWRRGFCVVVVV